VKLFFHICRNKSNKMKKNNLLLMLFIGLTIMSCEKDEETKDMMTTPTAETPLDPITAPKQSIDRFSAAAGTLMIRDAVNGLPEANAPINFDQVPFITKGFGPSGELVEYYNFDVMPLESAPIYVLFKSGESMPVAGQLNIVDVIPGNATYNDFWHVVKVTVPSDYVANTVTSASEIVAKGYTTESTPMIVNCPIVPFGSTATKRVGGGDNGLVAGWCNDKVVYYFTFSEAEISATSNGQVPVSPIYVTFNINPNLPNGGPASGFMTEMGNDQTHNVVFTIPSDADYSPLWSVSVYDNADFNSVMCSMSAGNASVLGANVMTVNCPVASVN